MTMRVDMTVTGEIKDRFFDRQRVIATIGRENTRKLGRIGAFVRRRAMTDILRRASKRRGKRGQRASARPGQPPLVHSRDSFATIRNILFGLHWDDAGVSIGPRLVPSLVLKGSTARTVPELLTKGGTSRITQSSFDGHEWQLGNVPQAPYKAQISAHYSEHPFMLPALAKEIAAGTVDSVWSTGAGY